MSVYLENYWTLYGEFIETFKQVKYKGIPIALLTNFYQQIDQELRVKMEDKEFSKSLSSSPLPQSMIQPSFEKELAGSLPFNKKGLQVGKILIHFNYTRIPESTYKNVFRSGDTVILTSSRATQVFGIPTEQLKKYEQDQTRIINEIVDSVQALFGRFQHHPAFGNTFFQQTFLKRIPPIVTTLCSVMNLFEKVPISCVVVGTTEDIVSRALAIVGARNGIKSICLQHGILMGEEAFIPVFTSKVAVYGEYERNWYVQRGLAPERIANLGHPKFDEISPYSSLEYKDFIHKYGLQMEKKTLLVITGPNIDHHKFERLIQLITSNPALQVLIKPHPWEIGKGKCGVYLELKRKYRNVQVYTTRDNSLYNNMLPHVDGIVSTLSTVALESILYNKPVFIYYFIESNRIYDYFDRLGEHVQSDPDRLYQVINQYFTMIEHQAAYDRIRSQYVSSLYINGSSGEKLFAECKQTERIE